MSEDARSGNWLRRRSSEAQDPQALHGAQASRLLLMYVGVAAVVTLGWLVFTLFARPGRVVSSFDDDAFYYFGVARNVAHGRGSTFNGIDHTNGYHPLWLLILTPIFRVSSGRTALMLVRLLESALFVVSIVLLAKIGSALRRPAAMAIGASILVLMGAAGPAHWFSGMESALVVPCVLAVVLAVVLTGGFLPGQVSVRRCWVFGCLLAVTVMARLDSVFLVAAVAGFALWRLRKVARATLAQYMMGLVVPALVTLATYMILNDVWFGTATPVSGQAKALGGPFTNGRPLEQFLRSPVVLNHSSWFGLIVLVTVPIALAITRGGMSDAARGLAYGAAILLVAEMLTVLYYSVTSSWQLWSWYFLSTDVVLATSVGALLNGVRSIDKWPATALTRAAAAALAISVAIVTGNLYHLDVNTGRHAGYLVNAVGLASYLDRTLPPDAVVAMGDRAGALGYYLERPVVQLEGLMGSVQYLDALRHATVHQFLAARRVSVYIRSSADRGDPAGPHGCMRFLEPLQGNGPKITIVVCTRDLLVDEHFPDGTYERVWRYRPGLNP